MIYLDNAATSFPKPPEVIQAVCEHLADLGGSPGRSGYVTAIAAARVIHQTRRELTRLIRAPGTHQVAFMYNATDALNTALKGVLKPGDHVITSALEHNAVTRPLHRLQAEGVEVSRLPYRPGIGAEPDDLAPLVRANTRLLAITHASNVTGEILPAPALCTAAKELGLVTLVDAAQTAGSMPIDVNAWGVDLLAMTGHKGLLGPQGTGALFLAEGVECLPLREGGTGATAGDDAQPTYWPDRFESGTPNGPGLAGLGAGIRWVVARGLDVIQAEETRLIARLLDGLRELHAVTVYGPPDASQRAGLVSLNIGDLDSAVVAMRLEDEFGIVSRGGLHCAPWAHECLGTLKRGTVRLSVSPFTTDADIDAAVAAVASIGRHL